MAHPLVEKYAGNPSGWSDDRRTEARLELFAAISADQEGVSGAKLLPEDRTKMLRLWLDLNNALSAPETGARTPPKGYKPYAYPNKKRFEFRRTKYVWRVMRWLSFVDYLFIFFMIGLSVACVLLARHSIEEAIHIEEIKVMGEEVVAWMKTANEKRGEEEYEPAACRKADGHVWSDCLAALLEENGPLHKKENPFQAGRALLQKKCDPTDVETIGSIVIEKGTATPAGTFTYAAFEGTEPLVKDMTYRVLVCGRGFHVIKIATDLTF
jgi:hypothetical protein